MAAYDTPLFRNAGESALIIEFGDSLDLAINQAVQAFDERLTKEAIEGISETAPTLRSVLVRFDPLVLAQAELIARIKGLLGEADWMKAAPPQGRRLWRLPARYGGAQGPDLGEIADLLGKKEDAVIAEHAAQRLKVLMLGFAPGLAHLGLLGEAWNIPRRKEVTPEVPSGSLLIAVAQTVLTASRIPTGWRVMARTPFQGFQPKSETPFKLAPGDEVQFHPIDDKDFEKLSAKAAAGEDIVTPEAIS